MNAKQCHFCTNNVKEIDYKDVETLKNFMDSYSRIVRSRKSSVCARHQRKMAQAIKQARYLALVPYITG